MTTETSERLATGAQTTLAFDRELWAEAMRLAWTTNTLRVGLAELRFPLMRLPAIADAFKQRLAGSSSSDLAPLQDEFAGAIAELVQAGEELQAAIAALKRIVHELPAESDAE